MRSSGLADRGERGGAAEKAEPPRPESEGPDSEGIDVAGLFVTTRSMFIWSFGGHLRRTRWCSLLVRLRRIDCWLPALA
jgi:hypothetical protein